MAGISNLFISIATKGAEKAKAQMQGIGKSSESAGGKLAKFGKIAKAGAVVALMALAKGVVESVQAFMDFDDKMTQSLAIMDTNIQQQDAMKNKALEVSRTLTISASESAEAYFFLASAGLDAEQSIAALPQVAAFAQAGMFDMSRATDLATDAQSALGLTVSDAGQNLQNLTRVTDVLVKANQLANASVEQFSEALTNKAGAALKITNKSIEEGVAVLSAFADRGVKGAEAGEKLNILLRDIPRAADRNKEVFEEFGIQVFDTAGNLLHISDIIENFNKGLGEMSDAEKAAALEAMGLTRGVGDAIKILSGSEDDIRRYEEPLKSAGGTTKEVAENQMASLKSQTQLMSNAMNELGILIGSIVAPALTKIVKWITKTTQATTDAIKRFQDWRAEMKEQSKQIQQNVYGVQQVAHGYAKYTDTTKDFTSATDQAIESASGLDRTVTNYATTTDIINEALKKHNAIQEETTENMEEMTKEYEESLIPTLKDAVSAYKKLQKIEERRADAEKKRNKASEDVTKAEELQKTAVENLKKAEEELERQKELSKEVTLEEELAIIRANEALAKAQEELDGTRRREVEYELAKKRLEEATISSTSATREELDALRKVEQATDDLTRADNLIIEAKKNLAEAQKNLNKEYEKSPSNILEIFEATQALDEAMAKMSENGGQMMLDILKKIENVLGTDFAEALKGSFGDMENFEFGTTNVDDALDNLGSTAEEVSEEVPPSTQAPSNFTSFGEGSMLGTHSLGTTNIITINPQAVMTDEDGLQQAVAKALVEAQQKGLRIAF